MARSKAEDLTTLQMALVGYQFEKQKIEDKIRELQAQLKGKRPTSPSAAADKKAPKVKRVLSPAARRRIAAAQKKRWAEHRKRAAQAAKAE
jgi:cell division septum initiation protein DivIVA